MVRSGLIAPALAVVLLSGALMRIDRVRRAPIDRAIYSADQYYGLAANLSRKRLFSFDGKEATAFRMPLFPAFIALTQAPPLAPDPRRVLFAQVLLDLAAVYGVFCLGAMLHSRGCGLLAAAATALYPALTVYCAGFEHVSFFAACVVFVALRLTVWAVKPSRANAAWLGLSIATSLWCRSTLILLPLFLWAAAAALRRSVPAVAAHLPVLLACAYLPLAPWAARNAMALHRLILLEDGASDHNLYLGSLGFDYAWHTEGAPPGWGSGPDPHEVGPAKVIPGLAAMRDGRRSSIWRDLAARNIAEAPGRYLVSCLRRLGALWTGLWGWLVLAALGAGLARPRAPALLLGALPACFCLYATMAVSWRFAPPAVPVLLALAALAAARTAERLGLRFGEPVDPSTLAGLWAPSAGPLLAWGTCFVLLAAESAAGPWSRSQRSQAALDLQAAAMKGADAGRSLERLARLAREPGDDEALTALGVVHAASGRWDQARPLFVEAVRRDPLSLEARLDLAAVLERSGRDGAAAQYAEALRLCRLGLGLPGPCLDPELPRKAGAGAAP